MSNCKNQSRACLEKHFEDFCIKLNWRVGIINEFNFAEQSVENELHYNGADESSQFLCLMLLVLALAGSCDCAGGAAVWRVWGQPAGQASDNSPPPTFPPPTCPTTTSRDLLAQLDCKNSLLSSDNGKTFLLRTGNCEHNKKTERDRPLLGTAGRWAREESNERYREK